MELVNTSKTKLIYRKNNIIYAKRRKNRLLLFKNGEVKIEKVIKIFIIFTIGFNCIACNPKHNDYSISVIDTSSTTNKSQITFYDKQFNQKEYL